MHPSKRVVTSMALLLALLLSACGAVATPAPVAPSEGEQASGSTANQGEAPGASDAATGDKVIKIYTSLPLQGAMIPESTAIRRAIEMGVAAEGGEAAGHKIEIVHLDDASPATGSWDATVEAENAQKCVNDPDCMLYIGTYNSGAAKVSIPILNQVGIAMISPANTSECLTKNVESCEENEPEIYRPSGQINYFRTNPADDVQGPAAAKWAQCMGFTKVFVLDDRQLYGQGLADNFEKAAKELGLEVVGHEGVESANIDFRSLLTKVKASGADLVFGGFVPDTGGPQIIQQMATLGLFPDTKFMGPDGLYSAGVLEALEGSMDQVNGNAFFTFTGLPPDKLTSESGQQFYADYKSKYSEDPVGFAAYGYQVGRLALDAINRAGEKDRAKILEAVRDTQNFDKGIGEPFSFNEDGDPTAFTMAGLVIQDGKYDFQETVGPDMTCKE